MKTRGRSRKTSHTLPSLFERQARRTVAQPPAEGKALARALLDRVDHLGKRVDEERIQRLESENKVLSKVMVCCEGPWLNH